MLGSTLSDGKTGFVEQNKDLEAGPSDEIMSRICRLLDLTRLVDGEIVCPGVYRDVKMKNQTGVKITPVKATFDR